MKRSYHSDIIIQYKLGMLPEEILKQIPSSTLDNWKKRSTQKLFGIEHVHNFQDNFELMKCYMNSRKLLEAAKALYFIYCTYVSLMSSIKGKKSVFRQNKQQIITTIDRIKENIGQKKALNAFGISPQQYYAWKNKLSCKISPKVLCRKIYPTQLTKAEVDVIQRYLKEPKYRYWNVTNIFFQILREKAAFFSQTTFYKYVNRLQLQRAKPEKKKYSTGLRAEAPKRILHMDVTIYRPLDHSKVYLYFLVDNFSRYILAWKASLTYSAKISFENITEAYKNYNLNAVVPGIDLITDGGSENKGDVDRFVNQPESNIQKLVAQTDIRYSNSMVEAVNKRMKYDFLFREKLLNLHHVNKYLAWAVPQYNHKPHSALYSLTPAEAWDGKIPDKNMYKPALKVAAQKRKVVNMNQQCLNCRP